MPRTGPREGQINNMNQNPYAPPQSNTEVSVLREVVPRPIAVWLFIGLLLVNVLVAGFELTKFLGEVISRWNDVRSFGRLAVLLAWRTVIIAVFLALAWCIYSRRNWSRWVCIALIVGIAAFSIFGPQRTDYPNEAQRAGGQFARWFFIPLLLAWWAYAFGFSAKAKRYFAKVSSADAVEHSPDK